MARTPRAGLDFSNYRHVVTTVAVAAGSLWLFQKLMRALLHYIYPDILPGQENTSVLASPRQNITAQATVDDLKNASEYDYIIVGTGTAGCVIAARLTEDPSVSVLAIESGHSDLKQLMSRIPAGFAQLFGTPADYNLKTTAQKQCGDRKMQWPRGRMIGGCSAINAMVYNKGAPDDFDEWARLGADGWSFKDVQPYMKKAECFHAADESDPYKNLGVDEINEHGRTGPWQTGYSWITPISKVFVDACEAVGIPKIKDFNTSKGMIGTSLMQTFIDKKGQRSSAAVAYLTSDVCKRPGLKIASGQTVTKIILDTSGRNPRACGVEMAAGKAAPIRYLAKAKKEVILCAGAVHSPQILMLSGLGPSKELQKHSIPVIKDIPGIGNNLVDHIFGTWVFKSTKGSTVQFLANPTASIPSLIQWFRSGTGPMTTNVAEAGAFIRTADQPDAPASLKENDLSSGPTSGDLEFLIGPVAYINHGAVVPPGNDDYVSVGPIMLRPSSRGAITLESADPFAPAKIEANYLSSQHDIDVMLYGMKKALDIARAAPFKPYFKDWYFPSKYGSPDSMTDFEILEHVRETCETIYHPQCTNKMGKAGDPVAVVDPELKVQGVDGLRIADASIFPMPVGCHPCAPVVMVGEKAADLIKGAKA